MNRKSLIWVGVLIGSTIGGLIPSLWGAGPFSFSSMTLGAVGAFIGIYVAFKLTR